MTTDRRTLLAGGATAALLAPVPSGVGGALAQAAAALDGVAGPAPTLAPDLTLEFITHRFTPTSREVLLGWYPGTSLEMDEAQRSRKTTKFGGLKYVYPVETMKEMRAFFEERLAQRLPAARILYWT